MVTAAALAQCIGTDRAVVYGDAAWMEEALRTLGRPVIELDADVDPCDLLVEAAHEALQGHTARGHLDRQRAELDAAGLAQRQWNLRFR